MAQDQHDPDEDLGGLVISDEVLAAIAVTAARDIEGVSALAPRPPNLSRLFKGEYLRYVKLTPGDTEIAVDLSLRIRAGSKITEVASGVQRAVRDALQGMTGRTVTKVNVKVLGVDK